MSDVEVSVRDAHARRGIVQENVPQSFRRLSLPSSGAEISIAVEIACG
jgi:hypothetical protein